MPTRVRPTRHSRLFSTRSAQRKRPSRQLLPGRGALLSLALVAFGLGLGFAGWRLYNSEWLTIQQVVVQGNSAIDEDTVRQAAALSGEQFFAADTDAAAARVKALPRVKNASIVRSFPHSATIRLTERTPVGVWKVGATSYLADDDGRLIDTTDDAGGMPVVDATQAGSDVQIGDRVDVDALRAANKVSELLPSVQGQSVVRFVYDKQTGLTAITASGTQVRLGDGQALDYKLAVWQQLAARVNPADLHEIDLRYSDRPFYR
jgi:cell division protein FtsQ